MRGKRSLLNHMRKINFEFSQYVNKSFKTMNGFFIPFPAQLDMLMAYLTEGVKVLFRYCYAVMKYHKEFIKLQTSAEDLMDLLKIESV